MKKTVSVKEHERIVKTLQDEIERKDKIIEKLKEENFIVLRTAIKQAEKHDELLKRVKKKLESE